jgi:deoxyribodipyrimidine photo-lyase
MRQSALDGPLGDASVPVLTDGESGTVVWHRDHLRISDHRAVADAAEADRLLPLFVFDPSFYGEDGLACDSRIRFLHDCLADLDDRYHTVGGEGLTYAHGDPIAVLQLFADAGWDVVAMRSPTGRYGRRRDERARETSAVRFVDGDGLVRDADDSREGWQDHVETWLAADQHDWDPRDVSLVGLDTGVTISGVESAYGVTPTKTAVPDGGTGPARNQLGQFVERIRDYPSNISSPVDARDGTSGLSPYLRFGCLSVRQVFQHVDEHAPDCRGKDMFVSRLFWNKHYEQKLEDWPGWLDRAVNPVLEGFNRETHDPELVAAWKAGETGFPMVDASMRCLRETGWLNFRMRAMCASVFYQVLEQPWRIGADWYYHHLVDSEASINYTQWQSQAGTVGKPTLRLYNPRKQVRDQDPDGEFIGKWVPELRDLPAEHLDQPAKTPLHVQRECGVEIGEDYPRPVVDYDAARQRFLDRYDAVKAEAAAALAEERIAKRASFSGGLDSARAIAAKHGPEAGEAEADDATQTSLTAFEEE